ncbi:MAG: hypothetical protein U0T73_03800 [Chitinophagales bacterium]
MKKSLLAFAVCLISITVCSQTILFNDGFEPYAAFSQSGLTGAGYTVKSITGFQVYNSAHAHYSNRAAITQITSSKQRDTLTTPTVGPLSSTSVLSFYFRIANTGGLYPLRYALGANEKIDLIATSGVNSILLGTITAANQNSTDTFVKYRVSLGQYAGISGKLSIAAVGTSTSDFFLDVDSLLLIDTVAGTLPLSVTGNVSAVKCFGGNSGAITLTPAGGTGSYTYNWGSGVTTKDRTNLSAGSYTVTVTDGSGSVTASFNVGSATAILTSTSSTTSTGSNGTASVTASGGKPPYQYAWNTNPVQHSSTASGLNPGTYYVFVTDSNGCSKTDSVIVSAGAALSISGTVVNVLCHGLSNGSINVTASGGSGGYHYFWNNADTTEDRVSLTAGSYTVTVSDASAATATATFSISEPSAIQITTSATASSGNDGSATATVSGGNPPYVYVWDVVPAQDSSTIINLAPGVYHVQIMDNNNCVKMDSVTVGHTPNGIEETNSNGIRFQPNPVHDILSIVLPVTTSGTLSLIDAVGNIISEENFNETKVMKLDLKDMPAGWFMVRLRTTKGSDHIRVLKY